MKSPRNLTALLGSTLTALCLACGAPSGELPRAPVQEDLPGSSGQVLASGGSDPAELFALDLGTGDRRRLELPGSADFVADAFWEDEGASALAVVGSLERLQVVRATPGGEPEEIVDLGTRSGFYELQGASLLATQCSGLLLAGPGDGSVRLVDLGQDETPDLLGRVRVLDVATRSWSEIGKGCVAALSPDAAQVAHSPDGSNVVISAADGSSSERVFSIDELGLEMVTPTATRFQIVGPMRWSEAGIAFAIEAEGSDHVVKLSPEGELAGLLPIRPARREFQVALEWGPPGEGLAVAASSRVSYVNYLAAVGLTPPTGDRWDLLSLQVQTAGALLWGPTGDELLVAGFGDPWLITDLDGRWLQRVPAAELFPLDWTSS